MIGSHYLLIIQKRIAQRTALLEIKLSRRLTMMSDDAFSAWSFFFRGMKFDIT
jgi:hypothetical protein